MIILALITIITFIMTARALLVVIGAYKDPILASFETYGDEQIFSPLLWFIIWVIVFAYVMLFWYIPASVIIGLGLIIVIPLAGFHSYILQQLYKHQDILRRYPKWYHDLIQNTDREERRRIAYRWLFLPIQTRMTYNTNDHLFLHWVEQVLLTVAQ